MNFKDKTLFRSTFLAIFILGTVVISYMLMGNPLSKVLRNDNITYDLAPHYKIYSKETLEKANFEGQRIVLFFHADWCSTCRAADTDILKNYNQLPFDVTVLKIDYDQNKELRAYYSVAYQHTYVQIDNQGHEIAKWVGGGINDIISNIKTLACIEGLCNQPKV